MAYGLAFQNSVLNMLIFAANHAALCSISALISLRMPRETMLAMRFIVEFNAGDACCAQLISVRRETSFRYFDR
jgi:hypothetical protein